MELHLAAEHYADSLARELSFLGARLIERRERLFLVEPPSARPAWSQWIWKSVARVEFESIKDGAQKLKQAVASTGKTYWMYYPGAEHRRASLLFEQLPQARPEKPIRFPRTSVAPPRSDLAAFTLWDRTTAFYSTAIVPDRFEGSFEFEENPRDPPSRAYLKLWEAFVRLGRAPLTNDTVLDLGGAPGSWTWALAQLGCRCVISVDRSELAPRVSKLANVEFHVGDAFAWTPSKVTDRNIDWLFSDVICEPERLYAFVSDWERSGRCRNFVCTLKFKGEDDPAIIDRFRAIPGSRIEHLSHNKHEVTWMRLASQ